MAEIRKYPFMRHLRSEASRYVAKFSRGKKRRSGRGASFWFSPVGTSLVEVPLDDRDMAFFVEGRSRDYQAVSVQGTLTWRVVEPDTLLERIDFSIDLWKGVWRGEPLEQIAGLLTGLVQQIALQHVERRDVQTLLTEGVGPLQEAVEADLGAARRFREMGLEVVGIRVASVKPSSDLQRALETPTFERLQQQADEATFGRRALAVEKERAIAENELSTRIELARRETALISQEDGNEQARARAKAEAMKIATEAEAGRIRAVEQARADMERARADIWRDTAPATLYALAAQAFAAKVGKIEHLNVTPDLIAALGREFRGDAGGPPTAPGPWRGSAPESGETPERPRGRGPAQDRDAPR